jgi:thiol-disulfide isomerase/thioredoxin
MNSFTFNKTRLIRFIIASSSAFCLSFAFAVAQISAQAKEKKTAAKQTAVKKTTAGPAIDLPKVTQVDEVALLNLLKRDGDNAKPLLVNFWATWCGPCVEEFPDLVKISDDYQGKIDVITVTLDDLAEINTSVPQFLAKMKATMPTYLLKTTDENSAIESVSKDWQGGLPFTILYDGKGATIYSKQAKFTPDVLRRQIDGILNNQSRPSAFERGRTDAQKDIAEGNLIYKFYNHTRLNDGIVKGFERNYGIKLQIVGISSSQKSPPENNVYKESYQYAKGYNSISEIKIIEKQGEEVIKKIKRRFPINAPADATELILTKK